MSTWSPAASAATWVNKSGAPDAKAKRVTPAISGAIRILAAKYCIYNRKNKDKDKRVMPDSLKDVHAQKWIVCSFI